jgi:hypothetical protein
VVIGTLKLQGLWNVSYTLLHGERVRVGWKELDCNHS